MASRRERRYEDILDVASRLFLEKGYERTSIQDIAAEVGVLKGSLYYYIDTKEGLLYNVIRTNHENLVSRMEAALRSVADAPAIGRVRAFLYNHMTFVLANVERSASFQFEFRSLTAERQSEIITYRRGYGQRLAELIREAQQEGAIAADVVPSVSSRALLSMFNSVLRWYRPGGPLSPSQITEQYVMLAGRALGLTGDAAEWRGELAMRTR